MVNKEIKYNFDILAFEVKTYFLIGSYHNRLIELTKYIEHAQKFSNTTKKSNFFLCNVNGRTDSIYEFSFATPLLKIKDREQTQYH